MHTKPMQWKFWLMSSHYSKVVYPSQYVGAYRSWSTSWLRKKKLTAIINKHAISYTLMETIISEKETQCLLVVVAVRFILRNIGAGESRYGGNLASHYLWGSEVPEAHLLVLKWTTMVSLVSRNPAHPSAPSSRRKLAHDGFSPSN